MWIYLTIVMANQSLGGTNWTGSLGYFGILGMLGSLDSSKNNFILRVYQLHHRQERDPCRGMHYPNKQTNESYLFFQINKRD